MHSVHVVGPSTRLVASTPARLKPGATHLRLVTPRSVPVAATGFGARGVHTRTYTRVSLRIGLTNGVTRRISDKSRSSLRIV